MNLKSLSIAASALLVTSITHAQTPALPIDRVAGLAIEDMRAAIQTRFDRMDTNGDGFLTKDEFTTRPGAAAGNARASGEGVGRTRDRQRAGDRPRAGGQRAQRQARMPLRWRSFDEFDSDQDGQVSQAEISAPIDELVSLDKNGDGRLDRSEMRAARQPTDTAKKAPKIEQ
ncbi:MAG: EF-hand domain-containing protein [Gammaproteobacteria bacterium]|nr:EF-hand domain-containing protein [Gammaproteobacteria bacterium]